MVWAFGSGILIDLLGGKKDLFFGDAGGANDDMIKVTRLDYYAH